MGEVITVQPQFFCKIPKVNKLTILLVSCVIY